VRALPCLVLIACGHHQPAAPDARADAPVADSQLEFCTAAVGTANVTAGGRAWTRLDAGGTWEVGPAAIVSPPMSLTLLVLDADPLPRETAWCCAYADPQCCTVEGFAITTDALASGAEVGTHPVMVRSFAGGAATAASLEITEFSQPFEHAPGHIAAKIAGPDISGTLANEFCRALLTETI